MLCVGDCFLNLALCFRNRLCSSASCNYIRERDNQIVRAVEGEPARFVTVLCRILGLTRSRVKYLTLGTIGHTDNFLTLTD